MRYLLYIGPGIGDWVIAMPMARRIKLNDKSAYITTLTCSNKKRDELLHQSLLSLQKWVDRIEYYSFNEPFHDIGLILRLGIKKYDYYFKSSYFDNSYISNWPNRIMRLVSKRGVGVHLINKPNLIYDYEIPFKSNNNVYMTLLELLEKINIFKHSDEDKLDLFDISKIESEFIKIGIKTDKKIISIIPGTAEAPVTADGKNGSKPAKSWPYKYWDDLTSRLIKDGYLVAILGGNKEKDDIRKLGYFDNPLIINLCGNTTIIESCAVLRHSILTVGGDTGMMHCSGAVGTPSLTLFGCTSYKNYLAYGNKSYYITSKEKCSPCFGGSKLLTCNDFSCMKHIDVDSVYHKINLIISETDKSLK